MPHFNTARPLPQDSLESNLLRRIRSMREVSDEAVVALREAIHSLHAADIRPVGLLEELEAALQLQLALRKPPIVLCSALHFEAEVLTRPVRSDVPREYPDDLTSADFG